MIKFLLIYSASITLLFVGGMAWLSHSISENGRLRRNQEALSTEIEHYITERGEAAAQIEVLELRVSEFNRLHAQDAARIEELGIALRRVQSSSTVAAATTIDIKAPLRDTVVARPTPFVDILPKLGAPTIFEKAKGFRWSDNWVTVEGVIRNEKVECRVESIDTLRQIVHRVPHKFLFFRFGTKAIRQEIISSNPHTKIVYAEYIELPRRRRKSANQ